jgi:uncharacterized protein YoxC
MDPLFWLGLSILLVAVSLTAVLVVAIPAFQELGRAARSAEKLFDTLSRELPPTLEAIRLTGLEISELTDDVSQGVQSAGQVVKQVDQSLGGVKQQAQRVQTTTRSVFAGVKAAWKTLKGTEPSAKKRGGESDAARKRLPAGTRSPLEVNAPGEISRDPARVESPLYPGTHPVYPEAPLRVSAPDRNGADRNGAGRHGTDRNSPELADESQWPPRSTHPLPPEPRPRTHGESRPLQRPNDRD